MKTRTNNQVKKEKIFSTIKIKKETIWQMKALQVRLQCPSYDVLIKFLISEFEK